MDDLQDALDRYMVRRVSLRRIRERSRNLNSTYTAPQKRREPVSTFCGSSKSMENHRKFDQTHYFSLKNSTQDSYGINSKIKNDEKSFFLHDEYDRSMEILPPNDDCHIPMKLFELSNPKKWNKPSKNADEKSKNNENIEIVSNDDTSYLKNIESDGDVSAQLLQVRAIDAEVSPKMITELKNIGIADNYSISENFSHDKTESSIISLTEAIGNLDVQIKNLEMRNTVNTTFTSGTQEKNPPRIYPNLDSANFNSIGPVRKNFYSQLVGNREIANSNENRSNILHDNVNTFAREKMTDKNDRKSEVENVEYSSTEDDSSINSYSEMINEADEFREKSTTNDEKSIRKSKSEDELFYQETPRLSRKMPLMESSRKSLHSDSTKIHFPTPTRVDPSSISSIRDPVATENSINDKNANSIVGNNVLLNETIPYEVEHFLEDALGDDFLNSTNMTYATCEARDRTDSHITASELISQDGTPLHRRITHAFDPPMTAPTHKNMNAFDRSMNMCRSLSQRIKKKFRSDIRTEESPPPIPPLPSETRETTRIRQLLQEVNVQQTLINQATKALHLCGTMKEFIDSLERIESERLLLIANLRKQCVIDEIKRITTNGIDNCDRGNDLLTGEKGEITMSDVTLDLREAVRRDIEDDEMIEWFVLVVSQGLKIWATQPITYQLRETKVSFPEKIFIPDLMPNFKIIIKIYTMKVRNTFFNHEDKYRIGNRQMRRSTSCPPFPNILVSPTKLLRKIERPHSSPRIHSVHASPRPKNTAFVISGLFELYLQDLCLSPPWPLLFVPTSSILQGTMDLNLECRLHLSVNHEGFVNHGDEAGGFSIWNRRFCVLKGHTIMFWNYPDEQETKEPVKTIDLINCVTGRITTADRRICARPRTLFFETARPRFIEDRNSLIFECKNTRTIIRNLISFDSVTELMEWSTKLNQVIMALREWNVIVIRNEHPIFNR